MADFGINATKLSDPQGQGASVVEPNRVNVGGAIADAVGQGLSIFANYKQAEKRQGQEEILKGYTTKLVAISDALTSGQMKPAEANTRAQSVYQEYAVMPNSPVEELTKRRDAIFKGSSLSEAEEQLRKENDLHFAAVKNAQDAGFVFTPSMSREDQNKLTYAHAAQLRAQAQWKHQAEVNRENRESQRFTQEQMTHQNKELAIKTINELSSPMMDSFNTTIKSLLSEIDSNKMDYTTADLKRAQAYSSIQQQLRAVAGVDQSLANDYTKLFDEINELAKKQLNPVTRAETAKSQVDEITNKLTLTALTKSGKAREAIVLNRIAPNAIVNLIGMNETAKEISLVMSANDPFAADNPAPVPPVIGTPNEVPVLGVVRKNMSESLALPDGDPKKASSIQGAANGVNSVLVDIANQSHSPFGSMDPKKLANAATLIASPEFGKLVEKGLVNKQAMITAAQVFQTKFKPVLEETSQMLFNHKDKFIGGEIAFSGGKLTFTGKFDPSKGGPQYANKTVIDIQVAALDKMVRAGAHLEGSTDYEKFWQDNRHTLAPTLYQTPGLKVGTKVQGKDGTYEYRGGFESSKSSWVKVSE